MRGRRRQRDSCADARRAGAGRVVISLRFLEEALVLNPVQKALVEEAGRDWLAAQLPSDGRYATA